MDIIQLIDHLENLVNESRSIPLSNNIAVDLDRILDLIDQMKSSIPIEIQEAKKISGNRERIQIQAKEEAKRIISLAREEASKHISDESIVEQAQLKANEIIAIAQNDAENLRIQADAYALQSLQKLEIDLERIMNQVRSGIATLTEDDY
jgi:cell division septum initiation protein DivIVA